MLSDVNTHVFELRDKDGYLATNSLLLDAVLVAVELVLESGSLSADHILNVLARLTSTAAPPSAVTSLQLKVAPVANTARYDRLRTTDEETRNA